MLKLDPFYPIVPDLAWLTRIVPLGVRLVQLRLKDTPDDEVRRQIAESLEVCAAHGCQLIVNDYWRLAIETGADFVHLGQEDLASADLTAIRAAGLKLGVSTHDHTELATARAAKPDYVALGPIYPTKLKIMPWKPQGLERVAQWRSMINCPLVAIGGITVERADGVMDAGAHSIAVITDFMTHPFPEDRIRQWVGWADGWRTHGRRRN